MPLFILRSVCISSQSDQSIRCAFNGQHSGKHRGPVLRLIRLNELFWEACENGLLKNPLFMPPTSKKLEGHIASGLFVRPSVRQFVTLFDA